MKSLKSDASSRDRTRGARAFQWPAKARKPFASLVATQLRVYYGTRALGENLGLGRLSRYSYLLMVLGLAPFSVVAYSIADKLAEAAVILGQPGLCVTTAVMTGQFMVILAGMSGLMSVLYYSNDLETLLAMPLSPLQVLGAKLTVAYVLNFLFSSAAALPFLIALGLRLRDGLYWAGAVPVILAVPLIPLAVCLFAVVLIMRFTRGLRNRDFFRVAFSLVFLALVIGFEYVNMNVAKKGPESIIPALLKPNGLVQLVSRHYPPLWWAAQGLAGESGLARAAGLALFTGISAVSILASLHLSRPFFLGGIGKQVRHASRPSQVRAGRWRQAFGRARSPAMAVMLRDHLVLARTPNFMLVAMTNLMIVPLLVLLSYITAGSEVKALMFHLKDTGAMEIIVLGAVGLHGVTVALNQIASTSVSREGRFFWVSKMIPVPPRDQVRGKLAYNMIIAAIQMAILLAVARLVVGLDVSQLSLIAVTGMLLSWPVNVICMLNDLYHPSLKWTEPQQAMKGNFQTLIAGILGALYVVALGILVKLLFDMGASRPLLYGVPGGISLIAGALLQSFLQSCAGKRYDSIEV